MKGERQHRRLHECVRFGRVGEKTEAGGEICRRHCDGSLHWRRQPLLGAHRDHRCLTGADRHRAGVSGS